METADLSHHIHSRFNADLEGVRSSVLQMGGLVEKQLQDGVRALVTGDGVPGGDRLVRHVRDVRATFGERGDARRIAIERRRPKTRTSERNRHGKAGVARSDDDRAQRAVGNSGKEAGFDLPFTRQ